MLVFFASTALGLALVWVGVWAVLKRRWRAGAIGGGLIVLAAVGVMLAQPGAWTANLPRPIMRLALAVAAPPPLPPTPTGPRNLSPGGGLPTPRPELKNSKSAWDRLVWQHQAGIAFQAWSDAVMATPGPITRGELPQLVPLAEEVHALYTETGYLKWGEVWGYDATIKRLAEQRTAAAGDPDRLARAEWVLAELQYIGSDYSRRPDFARVPDAVIQRALDHPDAAVRRFGVDRFGRRVHQRVMEAASPMPVGQRVVESLATSDADPKVRELAKTIVTYTDGFMGKK